MIANLDDFSAFERHLDELLDLYVVDPHVHLKQGSFHVRTFSKATPLSIAPLLV
jgi:hypothetical protein